ADRATTESSGGSGSVPPASRAVGDPTSIGRYRIIRRLGQGGFGRVYLARDDDLDRAVAIKVPNPERVTGPEEVQEYLAEARPPPLRAVLRRRPPLRRPLLRRLEVRRGKRPGAVHEAGPAHVSGVGRAGGVGRRGLAPRPYPGAGPPRRQARQHPPGRLGQA